ncbi:PD40 domain-containing protein [Candidatus Poribacteria bacterium]|nr:PD40 domain-containing protein [Candidatus Poribacteria bacterium]
MKKILFSIVLTFIFVSTFFLPITFAQDYQTWGLPDGAKARLGKGWISDIAYSPDGTRLAVASSIGIWIYDTETFTEIALLTGHTGYVNALVYSPDPDRKILISGGADSTVRVWNTDTGELLRTLEEPNDSVIDVAFSPDGKIFGGVMEEGYDHTLQLWDAHTLQPLLSFQFDRTATCLAFSSDSKRIAVGREGFTWADMYILDVSTGEIVRTIPSSGVRSIAFSSDGITLATGSQFSRVELWGARTFKHWQTLGSHHNGVNAVAFLPDGEILASAGNDNLIQLWNTFIGENLRTLEGHTEPVLSVSFNPNGNTLASASRTEIIFWDVDTGEQQQIITGHTHSVHSIALSNDGVTLASGYSDGTVQLWDVNRQAKQQLTTVDSETPITGLSFSPDGTMLAIGNGGIYMWNPTSKEQLWGFKRHGPADLTSITFSPDGTTLAIILATIVSSVILLFDVETGERTQQYDGGHDISFSPDSQFLAVASPGGINILHLRTKRKIRTLGGGRMYSAAYAPDGNTIAGGVRNVVFFWNVRSGEILEKKLTGHVGEDPRGQEPYVHTVAYSSNGKTLMSASTDGSICLWDVDTGERKDIFMGHTGRLVDAAYSPNGKTLASGSDDGTVLLWKFTHPESPQHSVDVNGDGVVNILDLTLVASNFGKQGENASDVNGDGVVNILDLTLVAAAFGDTAAAPEISSLNLENMPTRADVATWLQHARQVNLPNPAFQRGILILEQLLATLTPQETILLANYPNPFNPETWIPYQLAKSADVSLTIYDIQGRVARDLDLGHQRAGMYHSPARAAYWDGKNAVGEPVASGVYFYTLKAGDFNATRKMLIRK